MTTRAERKQVINLLIEDIQSDVLSMRGGYSKEFEDFATKLEYLVEMAEAHGQEIQVERDLDHALNQ